MSSLPGVLASLVVGSNWASTLDGSSRGLRTPEDRERFLALRNSSSISAIVVGSVSALAEPYQKTPHPLFIYRRNSGMTPGEFIEQLRGEFSGAILCEGGVTLMHHLLRENSLDQLQLTRAPLLGDGHYLDIELLRERMVLTSSAEVNGTTFEKYERASR